MPQIKQAPQTITFPDSKGQVDYRQRLLHHILAKFLDQQQFIIKGNEIQVNATPEQRVKIQSLIDVCTDDLDHIAEQMVYAYLRNKGMLAPKDFVLDIQEVA